MNESMGSSYRPSVMRGNKTVQPMLATVNGIFKIPFQGAKDRILGKQKHIWYRPRFPGTHSRGVMYRVLSVCQRMINAYGQIGWIQPEAGTLELCPSWESLNNRRPIHPSIQSYNSYISNGFSNQLFIVQIFLSISPIELYIFVSRNHHPPPSANLKSSHSIIWCLK